MIEDFTYVHYYWADTEIEQLFVHAISKLVQMSKIVLDLLQLVIMLSPKSSFQITINAWN